jgi:dihydrofolate reductase
MGKIIVSENVTLDGVVEDARGWFGEFVSGKDYAEWAKVETDEALQAEALLLGRRTDEWFAERWASRAGEWADRLNSMPKYIVSSARTQPAWSNATVLKSVAEVAALRRELAGEIVVYASGQLVRGLVEHDLVDQWRLTLHPVALGTGERLFGETSDKLPLRRLSTRLLGDSLVYVTYERVRG